MTFLLVVSMAAVLLVAAHVGWQRDQFDRLAAEQGRQREVLERILGLDIALGDSYSVVRRVDEGRAWLACSICGQKATVRADRTGFRAECSEHGVLFHYHNEQERAA